MTLTYRSVKGSALTANEFDGNTHDLDDRITAMEDNPPSAIGIAFFETVNTDFYVHMTDSSVLGPYTLPTTEWNFRGAWAATTIYAINDVVSNSGALYIVIFAHTSASVFDAGANDGDGHDFYELLIPAASGSKVSVTLSDTTFSATLSYANKYLRMTSGCTITIPKDATVDHAIDTEIFFRQCSDDPLVFVAEDSGVTTLNGLANHDLISSANGATIMAKKVAANKWDFTGSFVLLSGF